VADLVFQVEKAEPLPYAAAPTLIFKLRISATADSQPAAVSCVVLQTQIRIEPAKRQYGPDDQARLLDLYGAPDRWSHTLRTMLWAHASVVVPAFSGSTVVDLPVPCTSDFNIAAAKYFYALQDGEVPLNLLFSGTIFLAGEEGGLQIAQIPWEKEAMFRLPVPVWKQMMELYYPNLAWLCLRKDVFDRLYQYKSQCGIPTWEQAIEALLAAASEEAAP
jgi:hypothetical protein